MGLEEKLPSGVLLTSVEKFVNWSSGGAMFGLDPQGNVWFDEEENLVKIDTSSAQKKLTLYPIPPNAGTLPLIG